jgi:hypothetical protein
MVLRSLTRAVFLLRRTGGRKPHADALNVGWGVTPKTGRQSAQKQPAASDSCWPGPPVPEAR